MNLLLDGSIFSPRRQMMPGGFRHCNSECRERQAAVEADEKARNVKAERQAEALASQEAAFKQQQQALATASAKLQV